MSKKFSLNKGAVVMLVTLLIAHNFLNEEGQAFAVVVAITVPVLFLITEGENFWLAWGASSFFGVIFGILPWVLSGGEIDFFTSFLMVIGWFFVPIAPLINIISKETKKQEEKTAD